ncbi:cell division cycle protein 20 homolog B [Chionomys nivalis]|uniref:cell division cycle protein 20 homolog B n=1 Tax=Chionomys nivalis TaxID=269649 RepID=UPI002597A13B|nr:cell division cycle protein 20 homolog B [Chionomys nivalis]
MIGVESPTQAFGQATTYSTFRSHSVKRLSAEIPVASRPITTRGQPSPAGDQEVCSSALALEGIVAKWYPKGQVVKASDWCKSSGPDVFSVAEHSMTNCSLESDQAWVSIPGCRDGVRDESFYLRRFSSIRHFICHLEVELHFMSCHAPTAAMEWSPWQSEVLAVGKGMKDGCLHVFSVNIGKCIQTSNIHSQFCSLTRLPKTKEIATAKVLPRSHLGTCATLFRFRGFFGCECDLYGQRVFHNMLSFKFVAGAVQGCMHHLSPTGHRGRVLPLVLSSEDTLLFSAAADGATCVWKGHQSPSQS